MFHIGPNGPNEARNDDDDDDEWVHVREQCKRQSRIQLAQPITSKSIAMPYRVGEQHQIEKQKPSDRLLHSMEPISQMDNAEQHQTASVILLNLRFRRPSIGS